MKKEFDKASTREFKLGRRDESSVDMLNGSLAKNIMVFAIPIMLSTFLQLLFNAADLVVVGRFCGEDSLAAVGATSAVSQLVVNLFMGLSVGVSVRVSNGFGENSWIKVNKTVHTCIPLAILGGLFVAAFGLIFTRPLLISMKTPTEVLDMSVLYLKIYFCGIPFNLVYNYGAAVLRADGDTKKPLYFLAISGVLNVILNVFFVVVFHMNIAGVALATALTTALSAVLVLAELSRKTDAARLQRKYIKIDGKATKEILKLGLPAGLQQAMFSLANVLIQSSLNDFGKTVVAGSSAASSVLGFGVAILVGFSQACMNFSGQNYGAKQYDRVRKAKNICMLYSAVLGFLVYYLIYIFGRTLLGIYITDSPAAIDAGMVRLLWVGLPTFINGLFDIVSAVLRSMKYSVLPTSIAIFGICGLRLLILYTVFTIPQYHTLNVLYLTYPVSWAASFLLALIAYIIVAKKKLPREKTLMKNSNTI